VVAGNQLGVLNHTLLTVQAAAAAQLRVRAVVLNEIAPMAPDPSTAGNYSLLMEQLPHIPVVRFPWVPRPDDYSALAIAAEPIVNILLEP
jgi:dethiobiotin synthetase